jgi:gamma-D-glutamyl-L-lysine dipeptidyl-peptidase
MFSTQTRRLLQGVPAAAVALMAFAAAPAVATPPGSGPTHVVVRPLVNLYAKPSADVDVVSQAVLGHCVREIAKKGSWRKVRTDDAYEGWVPKGSLRRLQTTEATYASRPGWLQVTALQGNVYRTPDVTDHEPLVVLPFDARLEQASPPANDRWVHVRLPDRRVGWIQAGDVQRDPVPLSVDEAIALARRFLGVTYLWGGVSSFGIDCSGFTQLLLRARGIVMPRDAHDQAAWTRAQAVETASLEPGDLLFFGESMEKITHTGMYVAGGAFIHATPRDRPGVQISRLDDPHWQRLHVCSRRVR